MKNQLYNLWLEMLEYEKLPDSSAKEITLVCDDDGIMKLFAYAANIMWKKNWHIRVSNKLDQYDRKAEKTSVWMIISMRNKKQVRYFCKADCVIFVPEVYGVESEENLRFACWNEYRDRFRSDKDYLCAGELLCRIFKLFVQEIIPRKIVMTADKISLDDGTYMVWKAVNHPGDFFYFDNSYDGQLKKLQQCQLECLNEFDRVCKENHIGYFLGGGTLLGAIRHGAIIPWDDDIDVMMLREDYEKFVRIIENNKVLSEDFFYQSNRTDKDYHSIFDKIRMEGTVFKTEFSQHFPNMHQGIFIDIFVHDKTSEYAIGQKMHIFITLLARSLVFHKWEGTDMHFYGRMKGLCRLMTWYKNHTDMKTLEKFQNQVVTFFKNRKNGYLYDGTGEHLRNGAFPISWLNGGREALLYGRKYPVPAEAEKYLAYSYGENYMKLPAPQDRKATHPIVELKFKDSDFPIDGNERIPT